MLSEIHNVAGKLFVGRIEEQKQFRAALTELLNPAPRETLPYVCLLNGAGGMGKTTLAQRFCQIADEEPAFARKFQTLWIDWDDERKKFTGLQIGREEVNADTLFQVMYAAALREKWGRQFPSYRKAIEQQRAVES